MSHRPTAPTSPIARWSISAVVVALLASACGIPVSEEVEQIAAEDHQELLKGTTTTTEPVPEPEDTEALELDLYFIGPDNLLERVVRPFAEPRTNDVLDALEQGPLPAEIALFDDRGILESRIPDGLSATARAKEEDETIQRIDVDPAGELRLRLQDDPPTARLIVSQLVCTIVNLPLEVSGVEIYDGEDEPLQLSDTNAEPITGPADIADFEECRTGEDARLELLEEGADESSTTTEEG